MMAPSILLYFTIFLITGTLLEETSALMNQKLKNRLKRDIVDEAVSDWTSKKTEVRFNLAPSYGTLTSQSLQQLDDSLKALMGGILELDVPEGFSWKELRMALDNYPLMNRQPESSIFKFQRMTFSSVRFFGLGSDKSSRSMALNTWFRKLVGNIDVLDATNIDFKSIEQMVSKIDIDMINNLWTDKTKKKNLMDLGILRFPDISKPFFTLYRINLLGKCTYNTYVLHQQEKSEIVGLFQREIYYPDREYIERLASDVMETLISEVDALFS